MLLFITIVHFIVAVLLILLVLIQDSKGGGVFGMGSTGSNQVFSATGAANFLVKATRFLAIMFAVTCLSLTYITAKKKSGSLVDDYVPPAAPAAPAAPATPPAAAPTNPAPAKSESK
jgi:preprotein translocase subunit SecG